MRSSKLIVLSLVCLAMVVGGCGGKKPPAETAAPPPVAETTPPPPPPPADTTPTPTEKPALSLMPIYFEFDRSELRDDARATLAANAKGLQDNASANITIEGHCDERGTTEYNLALGEKRAKAAYDYLVSYGIPGSRLTTVSYGEERPADSGHDEMAWSKNRRAEFVVR
jgi:peptidoglycan-associated lipoprotein